MTNPYTNYSLEDLIQMKTSIDSAIEEKKRQAYEETLGKVLEALKVMAKNYPFEDAYELDDYDCINWRDLYDRITENI